jgi:aryl-alcohol dehydrogenase-like predicted oxidoreductase
MKYHLLGKSGLRVSELALGAMSFGTEWGWGTEKNEAREMLDLYIDNGGNFVDTASVYTITAETLLIRQTSTPMVHPKRYWANVLERNASKSFFPPNTQ